jgi:hypothetical protein
MSADIQGAETQNATYLFKYSPQQEVFQVKVVHLKEKRLYDTKIYFAQLDTHKTYG